MRERHDQLTTAGASMQRNDMLQAMALILGAVTWLNDGGPGSGLDIAAETQGPLVAVPVRGRREATPASRLSPREREVAALMASGCTNREIAETLCISIATVERHASNIYTKLGLHSRSQVAVWAVFEGLVEPAIA